MEYYWIRSYVGNIGVEGIICIKRRRFNSCSLDNSIMEGSVVIRGPMRVIDRRYVLPYHYYGKFSIESDAVIGDATQEDYREWVALANEES